VQVKQQDGQDETVLAALQNRRVFSKMRKALEIWGWLRIFERAI
jgi:hypothetical protein